MKPKKSIFTGVAKQTLATRGNKSTMRSRGDASSSRFQKNSLATHNTTESSLNYQEDDGDYILHPEILGNIKIDKGSLEEFIKMDDLDSMMEMQERFSDQFIISKIDKTGVTGKLARAEIRNR